MNINKHNMSKNIKSNNFLFLVPIIHSQINFSFFYWKNFSNYCSYVIIINFLQNSLKIFQKFFSNQKFFSKLMGLLFRELFKFLFPSIFSTLHLLLHNSLVKSKFFEDIVICGKSVNNSFISFFKYIDILSLIP